MNKIQQNVSPVYSPAFDVSGTPGLTVLDICLPAASGGYTFRSRSLSSEIHKKSELFSDARAKPNPRCPGPRPPVCSVS